MKRKYIDNRDWKRIDEGERIVLNTYQHRFGGYASALFIKRVVKKLICQLDGVEFCIADDGYTWIQRAPLGENWALTTMFDREDNIIEWYIDITRQTSIDEDGRPFYDDLYLDVVVFPTGEVELLDEDELAQALDEGDISQSDFDLAYRVAEEIMRGIAKDIPTLTEMSVADLAYFKELRRDHSEG